MTHKSLRDARRQSTNPAKWRIKDPYTHCRRRQLRIYKSFTHQQAMTNLYNKMCHNDNLVNIINILLKVSCAINIFNCNQHTPVYWPRLNTSHWWTFRVQSFPVPYQIDSSDFFRKIWNGTNFIKIDYYYFLYFLNLSFLVNKWFYRYSYRIERKS